MRFFLFVTTIILSNQLFAVEKFYFQSPNGIEEACHILEEIPEGLYSDKDKQKEQFFCSLSFYDDPNIGLCPKTWSTSPAIVLYKLNGTDFENNKEEFEAGDCRKARKKIKSINKYKHTMNQSGTSGTYSPSSLLYYHFSRYFDSMIKVPVAVYREMDKEYHQEVLAKKGLELATKRMNKAAWVHLQDVDSYRPIGDILTSDKKKIYGSFVKNKGTRYGPIMNGIRTKGSLGQSYQFQETPAFTALRNSKDSVQAVRDVLKTYKKSYIDKVSSRVRVKKDLVREFKSVTDKQMFYWMEELVEIVVLDYIFSQQDRVGNLDFRYYYYWIEEGEIKSKRARYDQAIYKRVPEKLKDKDVSILMRSYLNDNDAGARYEYRNSTKKTFMAENLRHFKASTYKKLYNLNEDLQSEGQIYHYLKDNFNLPEKNFKQAIKNTKLLFDIFKNNCINGKLKFDIDAEEFFLTGNVKEKVLDCKRP